MRKSCKDCLHFESCDYLSGFYFGVGISDDWKKTCQKFTNKDEWKKEGHAHWVTDEHNDRLCRCSNCEYPVSLKFALKYPNFCENCGAKMDEEKEP